MKKINLQGSKFGRLEVKEWVRDGKRGQWQCICDCGKTIPVYTSSLVKGRTKSCGCLLHDKPWKGCGDLSGNYWTRIKRSASKRGWDFDIDVEYGWDLFQRQCGRCALTGRLLHMEKSYLNPRHQVPQQTASLDRIDPAKGYVVGNVQWVHVIVNYMKQEMTEPEFIQTCKEIIEYVEGTRTGREGSDFSTGLARLEHPLRDDNGEPSVWGVI